MFQHQLRTYCHHLVPRSIIKASLTQCPMGLRQGQISVFLAFLAFCGLKARSEIVLQVESRIGSPGSDPTPFNAIFIQAT